MQKWSRGSYKIIDKFGQHFLVSPDKFDLDEYCKSFDLEVNTGVSVPVYYSKSYEMKASEEIDKYYPFENEETHVY